MLHNREVLPKVDYGERQCKYYENCKTSCKYMIITPDNEDFFQLATALNTFVTASTYGFPFLTQD